MKYALRIPDHYAEEIRALKGDSSINQFIVTAVVEKIATLKTLDYLKQRAERGDESHALRMLDQASGEPPLASDHVLKEVS